MPRLSQKQLDEIRKLAVSLAVAGNTPRADRVTKFLNEYLDRHPAQRMGMVARMMARRSRSP